MTTQPLAEQPTPATAQPGASAWGRGRNKGKKEAVPPTIRAARGQRQLPHDDDLLDVCYAKFLAQQARDPAAVDHIQDVWLGRPETMESHQHVVNLGIEFDLWKTSDLRAALQQYNLGTAWSALQDKIRVFKSSNTTMTFVTYSKATSKLLSNMSFQLSPTKHFTVPYSSRFSKNYHVTFRDVADPVLQQNLGIELHNLTQAVFCMTNPSLDDTFLSADLMVLFACDHVPPAIEKLRELTVLDSTGMQHTCVFHHRWASLNAEKPPSIAARHLAKAQATAAAAAKKASQSRPPANPPSTQTPLTTSPPTSNFSNAPGSSYPMSSNLSSILNPASPETEATVPTTHQGSAMTASARPNSLMASQMRAAGPAATFRVPNNPIHPRSPKSTPTTTSNTFDVLEPDENEDMPEANDTDGVAATTDQTPPQVRPEENVDMDTNTNHDDDAGASGGFAIGQAPALVRTPTSDKRAPLQAKHKPPGKSKKPSGSASSILTNIKNLSSSESLSLVRPQIWSINSERVSTYIAARAIQRHVAFHAHDATSIQDHVTNIVNTHNLSTDDPLSIYAATYPNKQTSPVFWALAALDVMLLTRDGPDPLARYLDAATMCSDTWLKDPTYHDGFLDDSYLFQLGHKPTFLARLRSKPGMPKEFKTALKVLKSIPLHGSLVPWAGPRRSLSAGLASADVNALLATVTAELDGSTPSQY